MADDKYIIRITANSDQAQQSIDDLNKSLVKLGTTKISTTQVNKLHTSFVKAGGDINVLNRNLSAVNSLLKSGFSVNQIQKLRQKAQQTGTQFAQLARLARQTGTTNLDFGNIKVGSKFSSGIATGIQQSLLSMIPTITATTVAYEALNLVVGSYQEWENAEAQQRKLEAVLMSTGYASGFTATELSNLAETISRKIGQDDDVIKQNLIIPLLTFRNVSKDVFEKAIIMATGLQSVLGSDSIIQLGKALNDPITGIQSLTRVGVQFTDQQKNMIKTMVEVGNIAGAQKIILDQLANEGFEKAAQSSAKASDKIKIAWDDLSKTFASSYGPTIQSSLENITKALNGINDFVKNKDNQKYIKTYFNIIKTEAGILLNQIYPVYNIFRSIMGLVNNDKLKDRTNQVEWANSPTPPVNTTKQLTSEQKTELELLRKQKEAEFKAYLEFVENLELRTTEEIKSKNKQLTKNTFKNLGIEIEIKPETFTDMTQRLAKEMADKPITLPVDVKPGIEVEEFADQVFTIFDDVKLKFGEKIIKGFTKVEQKIPQIKDGLEQIGNIGISAFGRMSDALYQVAFNQKSFGKLMSHVWSNMAVQISQVIMRILLLKSVLSILNVLTGGVGGTALGNLINMTPWNKPWNNPTNPNNQFYTPNYATQPVALKNSSFGSIIERLGSVQNAINNIRIETTYIDAPGINRISQRGGLIRNTLVQA